MKKGNLALVVAGFVLAAIAIGILITGCGAPEEPLPVPVEVSGPEPVTLLWWSETAGAVLKPDFPMCVPGWCDNINEPGDLGKLAVERWHEAHPEYAHVDIKLVIATYGGGRIGQELSAMVRAGEGPNIFNLYAGRAWLAAAIGIKHGDYAPDYVKEDYLDPAFLDPIMAGSGNISYPVANASLIERACAQDGFDCAVPEPWTVLGNEQFVEIQEAVKALDDGSYSVVDWGTNPSGQNMTWSWMTNAGIPAYDEAFTGFAGGEAVVELHHKWEAEGYMYPGPAGMTDADAFRAWGTGKVAFMHCRMGYLTVQRDARVDSGEAEMWDEVPLIGIEVVPGVTPLVSGTDIVAAGFVAENTPEEYREAAVSFLHFVLQYPWYQNTVDIMPTMHSQVERGYADLEARAEIFAYIEEHGLAKEGLSEEIYNLLREEWGIQKTRMYLGEATPAEILAAFQAKIVELTAD